ncbi:hypothetical protein HKD37_13G036799 [Glycine soja]
MRDFTLQGLMWMEEGIGWLKENKRGMAREGGFPLLKMLRLWISSIKSSETRPKREWWFNNALSTVFALSATLGFLVCLVHAKHELAAKRESALGRSCALSEMFNSSNF